jgi:hypothetical protein
MTDIDEPSMRQRFLEATHMTVAWFWSRLGDHTLDMRPPYQRNPVWQDHQKAYLIDTILRGYPVPELYLQTEVSPEGMERHVIVDGQQRIRACLEFIDNQFALGDDSQEYAGLSFNDLPDSLRKRIFEYKFVVRMLPALPDAEIREIFGRLNRNNIALNRQELRHATYWGEFITSMTDLSQLPFWVRSGLFTSNDFRRMLDVEYVSELATAYLFGPQNKKAKLDNYYADFEEEFPDREQVEAAFRIVLAELAGMFSWPTPLRWSRKVDFYTLFLVMTDRLEEMPFDRSRRETLHNRLTEFSKAVDRVLSIAEDERDRADVHKTAIAYARGVRNSSDLNSRRMRAGALDAFLRGVAYQTEGRSGGDGPLQSLPTPEELMSAADGDEADEGGDEQE